MSITSGLKEHPSTSINLSNSQTFPPTYQNKRMRRGYARTGTLHVKFVYIMHICGVVHLHVCSKCTQWILWNNMLSSKLLESQLNAGILLIVTLINKYANLSCMLIFSWYLALKRCRMSRTL